MHDCGAQQLYIAMGGDGSHAQLVADWSDYFAPITSSSSSGGSFKAHYDKARRTAVVAGTLLPAQSELNSGGVVGVQLVNISAFHNFFVSSSTLSLAIIPRTEYNVWEGGTKRVSMDVGGMEPRAVLREACPPTFRAMQICYCVYMERPAHMEFMRVYIPENGGMVCCRGALLRVLRMLRRAANAAARGECCECCGARRVLRRAANAAARGSAASGAARGSALRMLRRAASVAARGSARKRAEIGALNRAEMQDMEFYSYTTSLMDNALGHPLTRYGGAGNTLVYTLRGACFQIESRLITEEGKAPPIITLGNACKQVPRIGVKCALPLNNPFLTDIMTTPILLPDGLSATHTHLELSQIFGATAPASFFQQTSQNSSAITMMMAAAATGPRLYQSVLRAAYANTLPVDFVELAGVLDVVYVTPTSVGLISTKRTQLYDRTQPGYVRATNLILCPPGKFGSVGGVCMPCDSFSNGVVPVAYQIQCGGGEFETFTVVASKNLSTEDVHRGICTYTAAKNGTCPPDVSLASPQPFNMAADALDAAAPPTELSLVRSLITEAERTTGRALFRLNSAEYNARVVSQGQHILTAAANVAAMPSDAVYNSTTDAVTAQGCRSTLVRGVGGFLRCAVPFAGAAAAASSGGRRLLQALPEQSTLIEHQGPVYASNNAISWSMVLQPVDTTTKGPATTRRDASADSQFLLPLWALILIISVASALVLSVAAYMLLHRSITRRNTAAVRVASQFRLLPQQRRHLINKPPHRFDYVDSYDD